MKTRTNHSWRAPLCRSRWLECMTIIAVVVFALALFFPAASTARSGGKSALCVSNVNILGRAWMAYHEDYDGWLVGLSNYPTNRPPAEEYKATSGTPYRWVEYPLFQPVYGSIAVSQSECTLTYQLNGVRAGKLFAYTQNPQVYHCPNDKYWITTTYSPWISYSGSGLMNGEDFLARSGMTFTGFRTVYLPTTGQTKQLICVNKFSQIQSPASRFTFVEEDYYIHGQWRFAGGFVTMNSSNYWSWWDWPAWYHNGRSTLGFADGHAESHAWQDQRTQTLMRTGASSDYNVQVNNPDIAYFNNGYIPAGW